MSKTMTDDALVALLAQRILHWDVAPDRFLTGSRSWIPRWKFKPLESVEQAMRLLEASKATRYAILLDSGRFHVEVNLKGKVGKASGDCRPRTITVAIARSLGLEV